MNPMETVEDAQPAGDLEQMAARAAQCAPDQPICVYEVHLPSWMRVPEDDNRALTFFEIAPKLAEHATRMRFTHIQLHALEYTDPKGLQFLVDHLCQRDLGVILDTGRSPNNFAPEPRGILVDGQYLDNQTTLFGYEYKWDLAWAAETCTYFRFDPIQRKALQGQFHYRDHYAFNAPCLLPLSDELVMPPRPSLWGLMPGDPWRKFANLRLLYAYQYLLPGKKLLFMGNEFGQENAWRADTSLDWHLVQPPGPHRQLMDWVAFLNGFYRGERALHETDAEAVGFRWVDTSDAAASVISFLRRDSAGREWLLAVFNFTPVPRYNYRVGVPGGGYWTEVLNSDALEYGGSGQGNLGGVEAAPFGWNFQSHSLMLTLPPLGAVVFKSAV